jgi:integrase
MDGRWMARIDLGWQDGKRRRKAYYGATRGEVRDKLTAALRDLQHGTTPGDDRETVAQFLTHWLNEVAKARVRPRTFDTYEAVVRRHIEPHLGKRLLRRLTPQHVQAWLTHLADAGVTVGRRWYARVVLRAALNTAVRWRLVPQNVATMVDAPRRTTREIQPLTPEQARHLLASVVEQPLHAFVAVALGCGLRLGEALGLKWEDVDLESATLQVRRALQRFGGDSAARRPLLAQRRAVIKAIRGTQDRDRRKALRGELAELRSKLRKLQTTVQLVEPKSVRSRRVVMLPAVTVSALRAQRKRQLKARLMAGAEWHEQGFVFTTPIGTPADPYNLHKRFKGLLKSAGLPAVRIHDLRHSCATLLLTHGVDPRTIMQTLGHSQVSLTLNTYAHVLPSLQQAAAQKMNAILKG